MYKGLLQLLIRLDQVLRRRLNLCRDCRDYTLTADGERIPTELRKGIVEGSHGSCGIGSGEEGGKMVT